MAEASSSSPDPAGVPRGSRWHQRLSTRLAALAALVVAGAVALTLWVMVQRAEQDLVGQRQAMETMEAERIAGLLDERVRQALGLLSAARLPVDATLAPERLQPVLEQRPLLLSAFDSVFVAGADGRVRLLHDERGFRVPDLRVDDRDYFREVMATQAPAVSAPVIGRVSGEPIVVFAVPLLRDDRVAGLLGGAVRLRSHPLLRGMARPAAAAAANDGAAGSMVAVTDAQAHIIWHPTPHLIGRPVSGEPRLLAPLAQWARRGGQVEAKGESFQEADTLVARAGLPAPGWVVWRLVPRSEVMAPLQDSRRFALGTGALITLALTACLWALTRWLFRPLDRLRARAARLFDPKADATIGWPAAQGEVGELARALRQAVQEKLAQDARAAAMAGQLRSVLQTAPTAILMTRERRFELVSPAAARLLGRSEEQLIGQPASIIYASNQQYAQLGPQVARAFGERQEFSAEMEFLRGDGQPFWGRLVGRPVDWNDMQAGTLWTLADISQERREREALQWEASHDALTALANRAALLRELEAQLSASVAEPSALLLMDLDRFKAINDTQGHAAGDAMLRGVAQALQGAVRGGDLVARLGGDEFAVLLPRCAGEAARLVAESIRNAVTAVRVDWHGTALSVGISIGVAPRPPESAGVAGWMAAADAACYADKSEGKRRSPPAADARAAARGSAALHLVKD